MVMSSAEAPGRVPWLRLALGDLISDRQRTLLTLAVLVPAVVAYLVLVAVAQAMAGARGVPTDVVNLAIVSDNAIDLSTGRLDADDLAAAVAVAGDDASEVSGLIVRVSAIGEHVVQLRAAPRRTWADVHGLRLLAGSWPAEDELAVTEGVAAATGWKVGSTVALYGGRFRITALVAAPGTKFATVWMDLDRAQRLFDERDQYQAIVVTVRPGADADAVAARLADAPQLRDHVTVLRESAIAGEVTKLVRFGATLAVLIVSLAIATLGLTVFNLVAITALERREELGVLRLLGFGARTVRSIVVTRATIVSLVAYVAGAAVVIPWLARLPPVVLRSLTIETHVGAGAAAAGAVLAVISAAAAAGLALRRALNASVHELVART